MGMASREAVISLMNSIDHLPDRRSPPQIIPSYVELKLLRDTLGKFDGSCTDRSVINALDDQLAEAVANLKDALHHSLPEVGSVLETIKSLREVLVRESTTIGLLDQFEAIGEDLLDVDRNLKTVSLFGMAGIGKTQLAEKIFHHPIIKEKFRLRVWVNWGPKPHTEDVLMDIAAQIGGQLGNNLFMNDEDLRDQIYRILSARRYFIVLDDIWSWEAWRDLTRFFPDMNVGSRFLLTTRLEEVANSPKYPSLHQIRFLNQEESWNLLCRKVFGEEKSPSDEMEEAGRKIAEQCEGLPLLILKVARLLSQAQTDPDPQYWTEVANKQNGVFTDAYESIYLSI